MPERRYCPDCDRVTDHDSKGCLDCQADRELERWKDDE